MATLLTIIAALFFLAALVPVVLPFVLPELTLPLLFVLVAFGFGFVLVALAAIIAGLRKSGIDAR